MPDIRIMVPLDGYVIAASLRIEVDPVQWCRSANDAVLFRNDVKDDRIANQVTLVINRLIVKMSVVGV